VDSEPGLVLHTTIYLTRTEFDLLASLPTDGLTKRRSSVALPDGARMSVDVFDGELAGLILAEIELADDDAVATFAPPPWILAEVSDDERFTGGRLARTSRSELRMALGAVVGDVTAARLCRG
jgi:CYTH domain-containing protein